MSTEERLTDTDLLREVRTIRRSAAEHSSSPWPLSLVGNIQTFVAGPVSKRCSGVARLKCPGRVLRGALQRMRKDYCLDGAAVAPDLVGWLAIDSWLGGGKSTGTEDLQDDEVPSVSCCLHCVEPVGRAG